MNYHKLAFTDGVKALQESFGSRKSYARSERFRSSDGLTDNEIKMIASRDSFYVASIGENGFPYVQHRGGPKGFLKVLDEKTLGFFDFTGNKQYITLGNITHSDKVALFLMDYPNKTRLKVYARAEVVPLGEDLELEKELSVQNYKAKPERIVLYHIEAFDWNCPQHITPRYTEDQIQEAFNKQNEYVYQLELEVERLRKELRNE